MRTLIIVCTTAACAGSLPIAGGPSSRSWSEAQHDAQVLDRAAAEHEQEAESYASGPQTFDCGDTVLNDQYQTASVPLIVWMPCFDVTADASVRERTLARHLRASARGERATAANLERAATAACSGVPSSGESVFARREDIESVTPHYEAGELRGVMIVFQPDSGVTESRVRADLDCQHARWVMQGMPEDSGDLSTVQGAQFHILEHDGSVEVLVTTPTRDSAEVALSRASGLNAG